MKKRKRKTRPAKMLPKFSVKHEYAATLHALKALADDGDSALVKEVIADAMNRLIKAGDRATAKRERLKARYETQLTKLKQQAEQLGVVL